MVAPVPAQILKLCSCLPVARLRRRSLPHYPPRTTHSLFVAPARCGEPLFSSLSKSLFSATPLFSHPSKSPGVWGSAPISPSFVSPCLCGKSIFFKSLPPLCVSLHSFSSRRPLFSIGCSLFSQNTRVGVSSDVHTHALRIPEWVRATSPGWDISPTHSFIASFERS